MRQINNKYFFIIRMVVSFILVFVLFRFVPYKELAQIFIDSQKLYILLGFLAVFCGILMAVVRWRFLLSALGVIISFKEAFLAYLSGFFFNLFFPSFVAGDIFRGLSVSYRHGHPGKIASTVLMDRFAGFTALVVFASFSFFLGLRTILSVQFIYFLILIILIFISVFLLIFSKRIFLFLVRILKEGSYLSQRLISFHDRLRFFKKNPQLFLKVLLFSLSLQLLTVFVYFLNSKAFGIELPFTYFLIIVPVVMVVAILPITIAGAGTRDIAAVYFFSLVGIERSVALGLSLLNLTAIFILGIIGGILYLVVYHRFLQKRT